MKTAILIHGCHLQAKDWENIIWGNPGEGIFGRVSRALDFIQMELGNHFPEFIYWGTGASEKGGVKESEFTFEFALTKMESSIRFGRLIDLIIRQSVLDTESQTTPQEVARCMEICREKGVGRLVLVSSPTHIARCLQTAEKVRAEGEFRNLKIMAISADTCFANSTPADVLIVEPSHRGDRAGIPLHKTLKGAMFARKLPDERAQEFNTDLVAFLEQQKKKYLG